MRLYGELLAPFVQALRELGVAAELAEPNDVIAGGRKVSGTGAGQIGEGVVLVGNVMFAFPHERMARILSLPDERMREECLRLLRAHVAPLPGLEEAALKDALTRAYGRALGATPAPDSLRGPEREAIARWSRRLRREDWSRGPELPAAPGRQVKIRAGTWIYDGAQGRLRVRATVEEGTVSRIELSDGERRLEGRAVAAALLGAGASRAELAGRLRRFGEDGDRVLSALAPGLVVR